MNALTAAEQTTRYAVDWASPWTWVRLAFASMTLTLCVPASLLMADLVDSHVVAQLARMPVLDPRDRYFGDLVVQGVRVVAQCVTISACLITFVAAFSLVYWPRRAVGTPVSAAESAEAKTVAKLSNVFLFFVILWSISTIYILESYFHYIDVFDNSDTWFFLSISLTVSWKLLVEPRYLRLLRKILVRQVRSDAAPRRGTLLGPVGLARVLAVLVIAVTLGLLGFALSVLPNG